MKHGQAADDAPCTWDTVRAAEREAIDATREAKLDGYAGLAFSGGGIRSATFNLGVIQALAARRLLGRFDYLSTVSGGGYIGSWLTALIHRIGKRTPGGQRRIGEEMERALALTADGAGAGQARTGDVCPMYAREAVEHLRTFSNYLTPRPGLLGLDTLTGFAIYSRNLVLNFVLILAPAIAYFMLVHGLTNEAIRWTDPVSPFYVAGFWLAITSILIGFVLAPMPLFNTRKAAAAGDTYTTITAACAFLFCVATTIWFWNSAALKIDRPPLWHCAIYGACASTILWWITVLARIGRPYISRATDEGNVPLEATDAAITHKPWDKEERLITPTVMLGLLFGAIVSGAAGGVMLAGVYDLVKLMIGNAGPIQPDWSALAQLQAYAATAQKGPAEWIIMTVIPALIMVVLSIMFALQVAIARRGLTLNDTEILGRLGGAIMLVSAAYVGSVALAGFAAATLTTIDWVAVGAGITWVVSTLAGVMLGKSRTTGGPPSRSWLERAITVLPLVFMAGFVLVAALIAAWLTEMLAPPAGELPAGWTEWVRHYARASLVLGPRIWWVFVALVTAAVVIAFCVDINFFSYHLFYRNRLARCYLGASRWAINLWRPSRITGLDPDDEVRMTQLAAASGEVQRPFHIVNTALNLTRPENTAWLQRQAAPFVFTPKYCGYSMPGTGGLGERSYYRPTARYLGESGPALSHAMTISGAAASPNMGYHSSPAMAFLLTVFNVRLGSWCGNPNKTPAWTQQSPRFAYRYLLSELLGRTDENKPFIYLTDGGHFDNLGVYELVRRRCRLIVASDAGSDPKYALEDLANTIAKCELDFGVRFGELKLETFAPRKEAIMGPVAGARQCTGSFMVGKIHYPIMGDAYEEGTFIYIKAALCGDEPADILHYAAVHPLFPHESTSDQWFDEQQFESYRKLGFRAASAAGEDIAAVFARMAPGAQEAANTDPPAVAPGTPPVIRVRGTADDPLAR